MRMFFALTAALMVVCTGCQFMSSPEPTAKDFSVNAIFGDHMVLQREMQIPVWGKAGVGETVVLKIHGRTYAATADMNGKWQVKLDALPVGGSYELSIAGKDKTIVFKDILCGDVWICSGQSNMEWSVASSANATEEIAAAKHPNIRLFHVARKTSPTPLDTVSGEWLRCSPESIRNFSAVGYYFGRELHRDLQVPIGLINTSWGGTPADAWTERSRIEADPILKPIVDRHERQLAQYPEAFKKYQQKLDEMKAQGITQYHTDPGNIGLKAGWNKTGFDDSSWKTMKLPCTWESNNYPIDGVFWFRKTVEIPETWKGKDLALSLDFIDDFDITYFNGVHVGGIGEENQDAWRTPRNYTVPGKLVKPGKAVIAVRVFDRFGAGGIYGSAVRMFVTPVDAGRKDSINIAGDWKYHVAHRLEPKERVQMPRPPYGENIRHSLSGLYNAMIKPIIPFGIKGAIWYQGESNAGRAWQYRTLLPVMIECWRQEWNQGDFPFLIVQLANFKKPNDKPVDSSWAELREAQALTVEKLSNCGLAVAIDIGESNNIHPKNKQDVGKRLAQAALKIAYGQDVVYSGPAYLSHEINRDKIIVQFKHAKGGLVAKNGKLKRFQIAGEDKKFVWADAVIDGTKVIVSSPEVKVPVAVRYAWSDNPEGCNLYNKEGLPAVPFRTDTWEGVTDKNR